MRGGGRDPQRNRLARPGPPWKAGHRAAGTAPRAALREGAAVRPGSARAASQGRGADGGAEQGAADLVGPSGGGVESNPAREPWGPRLGSPGSGGRGSAPRSPQFRVGRDHGRPRRVQTSRGPPSTASDACRRTLPRGKRPWTRAEQTRAKNSKPASKRRPETPLVPPPPWIDLSETPSRVHRHVSACASPPAPAPRRQGASADSGRRRSRGGAVGRARVPGRPCP